MSNKEIKGVEDSRAKQLFADMLTTFPHLKENKDITRDLAMTIAAAKAAGVGGLDWKQRALVGIEQAAYNVAVFGTVGLALGYAATKMSKKSATKTSGTNENPFADVGLEATSRLRKASN